MEAKNTDHAPAEVIPVTKDNAERELTALGARLRWGCQKQGHRSPTGPPPFALPSSSALVSTPLHEPASWGPGAVACWPQGPPSRPPPHPAV